MMKALVLKEKNALPVLESVASPKAVEAQQVVVSLKAASLNHRDVWIMKGQYPGLRYPLVPGSDGAGICEGREVVIQPGSGWGDDERFQSDKYQILGLPQDGCLAEEVVVERRQVYPKPAHLSMEEAAALPLAGLTAFRTLFSRCKAQAGEKLLVTGAGGGVALFCVQFALKAGMEVYVTSGSDWKIDKCKQLGVAGGANYKSADWAESLKRQAGGFDVVIDSAGGPDFSKLIKLCNAGGRIGIYGGTNGAVTDFSPQSIFWKQVSILGSTMGSDRDFEEMLNFVETHKIVPIVDSVFDFANGAAAFERMAKGAQFGKIVVKTA